MGKLVIILGGAAVVVMEAAAPLAHDPLKARVIAALIVIAPFAAIALWLEARRRKAKKAARSAQRPGYVVWQGGRR